MNRAFQFTNLRLMAKSMPLDERETDRQNWTVNRIAAAVVAILVTAYSLSAVGRGGVEFLASWFGAGFVLAPATIAALCWWFAARGHIAADRARMKHALVGAVGVGGIAFLAGFFGPIILTPDANQGPLLGIFITGPLGFVAGALLGTLYSLMRVRPSALAADQDSRSDD